MNLISFFHLKTKNELTNQVKNISLLYNYLKLYRLIFALVIFSKEEIEKMQTKKYSKETFDIQYPLLQKAELTQGKSPKRYYSNPLKIYGEYYFLCSEWFEVAANNDRPYFMKWLAIH